MAGTLRIQLTYTLYKIQFHVTETRITQVRFALGPFFSILLPGVYPENNFLESEWMVYFGGNFIFIVPC